MRRTLLLAAALLAAPAARAGDGNRLTYLDGSDPYYVSRNFPRLVTPQWVGEEGVDAVVVLAIDDMRGTEPYETFLRPLLRRLEQLDGRAAVSIMTCRVDPKHTQLQAWLKEGLSLETHTVDHPCPLLQRGALGRARSTYDRCVDQLAAVPGGGPVAFRVPCCDSLNTASPRFYAEVFNKTTPAGHFLALDSSVFNVFTADDPDLPAAITLDPQGRDRFRPYFPADRAFVNWVENYPYPYVIGRLCWEFPCVTPSDWEAQHRHRPNNPLTVRDWKAALDATVLKQGTMNLVFHPHNWIKPEQVVELVDYAASRYGKRVKFLTFREAHDRLTKHLLGGVPLRAADGGDNGVRLLDVDNDGYMDVVIGNDMVRQTRVWSPRTRTWAVTDFPAALVTGAGDKRTDAGARFGVVRPDGHASLVVRNESAAGGWHFDAGRWVEDRGLLNGLELDGKPVLTAEGGRDHGVRLRDVDGDGRCELLVGNSKQNAIFGWDAEKRAWARRPFALPAGAAFVDADGHDNGLRFADVDEDGHDDLVFANEREYGLYLYSGPDRGWARKVRAGKAGTPGALPPIARAGTNNGAWFHSRHLWVQNEDTANLKDHVDRRSFDEMLSGTDPGPKSPEASRRAIQLKPGFVAELVASEPLVQSPIAFAWGADGRLWVVEMGDYPLGADGKGKPGGRVKVLEDTDGDGRYDKATVFLDGLRFPTGVTPWRKGVLITSAPYILYAEDTDGDGKADVVRKLYSGFVEGNPQHRVNGLVWGLDNWLYGANGDSGGRVTSARTKQTVDLGGRDFRVRPDEGLFEPVSGQTQYGRNRNDWGDWFGNNNSNPLWHYPLDDRLLRRNPHVAPPDPRVHVPAEPGAARVFPVSREMPRFNDPQGLNHFTSACSPVPYRDELFGPAYAGSFFVSEPVHNLVHREVVTPDGVTFRGRRADDEGGSEFLASRDNWFRPTMLRTGPDGALWVADMYRFVIEHPEWIPPDWQKRLDLRAGSDKGRIYRVYPQGKRPRAVPRLDKLDAAGLVAALDSPNGWQRDTAQQLLLWRADKAALPLLEKLAAEAERPLARLHALCTLDGLGALTPRVLRGALADGHPGVRRHAVRLSESLLARAPELGAALLERVGDADAGVRMQLAYTLGAWDNPQAGAALGKLAVRSTGDRFLSAAVLSSVSAGNLEAVVAAARAESGGAPPAGLVDALLRTATGSDRPKAVSGLLQWAATPEGGRYAAWQYDALAGLLDSLESRGSSLGMLGTAGGPDVKAAVEKAAALVDAARARVADNSLSSEDRARALALLGRDPARRAADLRSLSALLTPQTPDGLQAAAVAALGRLRDPKAADVLLHGWKGFAPARRTQVLDALLVRAEGARAVLDAVGRKEVLPAEVDAARRQRLLRYRDAGLRERAAKLLAAASDPDRQKVIDAHRGVAALRGDPARGKELFAKHCAACHRLGGVGNEVGPDLASLADKSAETLLVAVLDPSRAVEARYVQYQAETRDGRQFSGVLSAETGASITLTGADGKPQVLLRRDLESLTSTGKSAMPDGLEKDLAGQDFADLFAHLRSAGPTPKRKEFAGNRPEVVRAAADGSLKLTAANAEVYGPTVVLEPQYGNLGYWSSEEDHAAWEVEASKAGRYEVWLDWACPDGNAGNHFQIQAGVARLTEVVTGTGSWDAYRQAKVGELELKAGRQRLVFRSDGKVAGGALLDLRGLKLVPANGK